MIKSIIGWVWYILNVICYANVVFSTLIVAWLCGGILPYLLWIMSTGLLSYGYFKINTWVGEHFIWG